jgi:hypothetical protein
MSAANYFCGENLLGDNPRVKVVHGDSMNIWAEHLKRMELLVGKTGANKMTDTKESATVRSKDSK